MVFVALSRLDPAGL